MLRVLLLLVSSFSLAACGSGGGDGDLPGGEENARYRVEFLGTWTADRFPTQYPGGPHFSPLIGAVHNEQVVFWTAGQLASDGVEVMAETGGTGPFSDEIQTAISQGSAVSLISAGGLPTGSGQTTANFSVSPNYPQLSLVSMIAPSPDWFVGVHNLSLRNNGDWVDSMTVELAAYDAGTDNGASYSSANSDSQPAQVITRLSSAPADSDFLQGVHRDDDTRYPARFVFTRVD